MTCQRKCSLMCARNKGTEAAAQHCPGKKFSHIMTVVIGDNSFSGLF